MTRMFSSGDLKMDGDNEPLEEPNDTDANPLAFLGLRR